MDVGASGGQHFRWAKTLDKIRTLRFDPSFSDPESYSRVDEIPIALAETKGPLKINFAEKIETSSKFKPNLKFLSKFDSAQRFNTTAVKEVKADRLDAFLSGEYWFAKLDVQGMELEILQGSGDRLSESIGVEVEVEFAQLYLEQPLQSDLFEFLRLAGFDFVDFLSLHRWSRSGSSGPGQLVFADALFLRTPDWVVKTKDAGVAGFYVAICLTYGRLDLVEEFLTLAPSMRSLELEKILKSQARRFQLQQFALRLLHIALRPMVRGSTVYLVR